MSKIYKILVINPGSTTTKLALYENERQICESNIEHNIKELTKCSHMLEQLEIRKESVNEFLEEAGVKANELTSIASRGGVIGHIKSGAYLIDEKVINACKNPLAAHASNLGPIIAKSISDSVGINAYFYDAVCVDEAEEMVKLTGMPELKRDTFTHVLNSRAVAIKSARQNGSSIDKMTFIVTHMGGGITSNLINKGKIIDLVSDDEGTFSPERTGKVGERNLIKMCYNSGFTEAEMQKKIRGEGGLVAYLGTNDAQEVEKMIKNGNKKAEMVYRAMAYQICKDIGSLAAAAGGVVDNIILTGGIAHSKMIVDSIIEKVRFIAPVQVFAGTYEMDALANGILRVIRGEEVAQRL